MAVADVTQTTAASQPLLLAHSGVNYWWNGGVAGNYVSTPDASANQITGDIEFIAKVDYISNGVVQVICSKRDAPNGAYVFYVTTTNLLSFQFALSSAPSTLIGISSSVGIGSTYSGWLKCTRSSSTGEIKFYTSNDNITYTQLGTTQTSTSGALNIVNTTVLVGSYFDFSLPFQGKIYRATISNSIGGAPVVDFNPATYNAATSQTAWTSATGEVWTINTGTAATGYKGVLVDRTVMQGDGVDDNMLSGTVSISSATNFLAVNPLNLNSSKYFIGSNVADVNILYYSPSTVRYGNTTPYLELNFTAVVQNRLALFTAVKNGVSSLVEYNNANQVTGSVGVATITSVKLFSPSSASLLGNINLNSLVISGLADNLTTRTAMYNIIRSMNNNAF